MRKYAVSLHLPETKATASAPTMSWLACNGNNCTSSTSIHFVVDQVAQSLVENRPNEY